MQERYMVGPHHTGEADVAVSTHRLGHVGLATVVEGFVEVRRATDYVAKMNVENMLAQAADRGRHVDAHLGETTLAKGDAVRRN